MYADDTTLFRSVQSLAANGENSNIKFENEINIKLGNIANWLTANKLSLYDLLEVEQVQQLPNIKNR